MLIQFVFIAAFLVALSVTWKRAAQGVISRREALLWSLVWIGASIIILHPNFATRVAQFFCVGRGSDFMLYGSVIVLFFMVFRIFIAIDKLERQMTDVIRREALRDIDTHHD